MFCRGLPIHKTRAVFLGQFNIWRGFYCRLAVRQEAADGMEGAGGKCRQSRKGVGRRPTTAL